MATEIKAPVFPESVADGTVASWHKKVGEPVTRDEVLADIETDKVVLEVVAPSDGVLTQILKNEGDTVLSAEVLALFESGSSKAASQQAVRDWGEEILRKGIDFMVIATGAYGDPVLWRKHVKAAEKSGARLRLPSGAIAGLDGLLAMRLG